jgi:deoxycytidylate deaminase
MNKRYFRFAREAAMLATYRGTRCAPKIGIVAVYKGSIIGTACNTNKTSPLQARYNVYRFRDDTPDKIHAETALIQKIRWKFGDSLEWNKVELYLYREYKDGSLAPSAPCASCERMLRDIGIKKVHCTTENGFISIKYK